MVDKPRPAPSTVFLTGPHGCMGRAVQAYLKREHPEVTVMPVHPFPFSWSRLTDTLRSEGPRIGYWINCAGRGSDAESIKDPSSYMETNAMGVLTHLDIIRQLHPHIRYVNLGSIYERDEARGTPYVVSKRMARQLVTLYREQYGLHVATATLGFTEYYGRSESYLARRISKGVARIAHALKQDPRGEVPILELRDPDHWFKWTWAEDVAAGLWWMLNSDYPQDKSLIYSVDKTVRHFVHRAFTVAGIDQREWDQYVKMTTTDAQPPAPVWRADGEWPCYTPFSQLVSNLVRYDLDLLTNPRKPLPTTS